MKRIEEFRTLEFDQNYVPFWGKRIALDLSMLVSVQPCNPNTETDMRGVNVTLTHGPSYAIDADYDYLLRRWRE